MQGNESQQHHPLQRGDHVTAATLPVDSSFVFDEGRGTTPFSQQGTQQPTLSASRQRPRFATAQDLDDALLQAIEGKITRKNAWVSKDASNLLEGITHTVESTLDSATVTDEYSSFAKVATVVEGCSKVWTSRVDSTYQRSNQMVRRLLRNEEGDGDGSDGEGNGADGYAAGESSAAATAERRKKAAERRTRSVRTIALDPSEINLDGKGRMTLVHTGVNAQFRAITEKFDQGNAQGLLLHNTPLGSTGNLILDVDYTRETGREYSARRSRLSGGSRHSKQETEDETLMLAAAEEFDVGLDTPLELPSFPSVFSTAASARHSPQSGDKREGGGAVSGNRLSGGSSRVNTEEEVWRPSMMLPSLLLLPHTAPPEAKEPGGGGHATTAGELQGQQQHQLPEYNHDGDDGAWGGGVDYGDAFDDDDDDNNNTGAGLDVSNGNDVNTEALCERVAAEARHLVSGVTELNAIDGCLFGENRLALEAEDPTSWFPLAEPPANALLGGAAGKNSELLRLHKEHRITQAAAHSQGGSTPANKRAKRGKTVAFNLPGELAIVSAASGPGSGGAAENSSSSSFFLLGGGGVDSSALRQSTTFGKNMTPLGKGLLLGKDPNAILAFTQSVVQRSKAQEAGLLLPEPPVPGKSIPAYLPYPIHVPAFFQPFSTSLLQWNLLRKSASGHSLALSSAAPSRRVSGVLVNNNWDAKRSGDTQSQFGHDDDDDDDGSGSGTVGAMPVEFFHGGAEADDEFMGAGGFDDYDEDGGVAYGDTEDPLRQVEAQILSSFERPELARANAATTVHSDGRRSGASALADVDPLALVRVLQPPQTALPSQVDVVRLRQEMWGALENAMRRSPAVQVQHHDGEERRKLAGHKRRRVDSAAEDGAEEPSGEELPRFSEVVVPILPRVSTISATGTLSPAFFFFSILFLANEHGVMLESVPGLDDLVVLGVSGPATPAAAE
ncbi:chromosome-associated protein H [Trypanosoma rangeli]|uniref:Condensin complex subunit 2 n=1 Tax=Trypanosoma rangeli TaxID=5698 RepID=A0A422NGZ0_TRYRA|nr:chromosome-associated protein H [Trypanosoma rangeli]RNF04714.1 chromosome-associated protein H [Trypanosoma rangeli]|eukprot:RNF04714.1 chromosome-associated protein H [Trypanosoma rangeli]